ncbi:MAG: hypothetical protein AB7N76_01240 [Planctomycetota bacterium]
MSLLASVRERLERRAQGLLSADEEAALVRDARLLRRRVDRLKARHPGLEVELSEELDELAPPPVLSASG